MQSAILGRGLFQSPRNATIPQNSPLMGDETLYTVTASRGGSPVITWGGKGKLLLSDNHRCELLLPTAPPPFKSRPVYWKTRPFSTS